MKNQDWRERFNEQFPKGLYEPQLYGLLGIEQTKQIEKFIESELQAERERVKKAVLGGLPESGCVRCEHPETKDHTAVCKGLSEVERLVESL